MAGRWRFFHCTQSPYVELDWEVGLTLLPRALADLLRVAPAGYRSFYLFKTRAYRPRAH